MKKSRPQNLSIEGPGAGPGVGVVSAGLRVVVVPDATVVGEELVEFNEQLASTIGRVTAATAVSNFLSDLISNVPIATNTSPKCQTVWKQGRSAVTHNRFPRLNR